MEVNGVVEECGSGEVKGRRRRKLSKNWRTDGLFMPRCSLGKRHVAVSTHIRGWNRLTHERRVSFKASDTNKLECKSL
jgi:hypothetical protein